MGKYVESNLTVGEKIVYQAKLHWSIFIWPVILMLFYIGFILIVPAIISYINNEYAITNKRVMIKAGWISRRTLEINLNKVESVLVEQGILGRMLGYGTITVVGSGGTRESFSKITDPLNFRKALLEISSRVNEKLVN